MGAGIAMTGSAAPSSPPPPPATLTQRLLRPAERATVLVRRWHGGRDRAHDAASASDESLVRYDAMLAEEAAACDVPSNLLRAICWYASGWRQFEPGGRVLATPTRHGASFGCMQLNDYWHPDAFPAATSDARASIRYAANHLFWLRGETGSWEEATRAFFGSVLDGDDRRSEAAARRVQRYAEQRPWEARLAVRRAQMAAMLDEAPGAATAPADTAADSDDLDLYADLAL